MKLKITAAIALVFVAVVGLWFALHRSSRSPRTLANAENSTAASQRANGPAISQMPFSVAAAAATPSTRAIVDPREDYRKRMAEIDSLSTNLESADQQVIENFLTHKGAPDNEQSGQVLKNELLNTLCSLNPPPPWLTDALIQMYNDRSQNVVVRDYAVQHMAELYRQIQDDVRGKQALQNALWGALAETEDSIGGTALLSLEHLSQDYAEFDRPRISEAASRMAKDDSISELPRITAFQVCAELGASEVLPVILRTAQMPGSLPLRISAVGALGLLAGTDQISFLNGLVNGDEDRLKPAAKRALDQIAIRQRRLANQK